MRNKMPTKKIQVKTINECLKIRSDLYQIKDIYFVSDLANKKFVVDDIPGAVNYLIKGWSVPVEFTKDLK